MQARDALQVVIGVAAVVAPILHIASDAMEWAQGGYSTAQLWLNYAAFLPMPWLLLGFCALRGGKPTWVEVLGAVLYGVSFTYFAHTTLYALAERIPTYEALWARLGSVYTIHGALMVAGGLMFGVAALRARYLPRAGLLMFISGLVVNGTLAATQLPAVSQTLGSAARSLGLITMGLAVLRRRPLEP
jgi:hypothetical protein